MKRRSEPRYWWLPKGERPDDGRYYSEMFGEELVFNLYSRIPLIQFGLAGGTIEKLAFDPAGLAAFKPGLPHSQRPRTVTLLGSPIGGDGDWLPPIAAQWLWEERTKVEEVRPIWTSGPAPERLPYRLTNCAWCTHCGSLFRGGRGVKIAQDRYAVPLMCPDHRKVRPRPQLRECAAVDCDEWFVPSRASKIFCGSTARCRTASASGLAGERIATGPTPSSPAL